MLPFKGYFAVNQNVFERRLVMSSDASNDSKSMLANFLLDIQLHAAISHFTEVQVSDMQLKSAVFSSTCLL